MKPEFFMVTPKRQEDADVAKVLEAIVNTPEFVKEVETRFQNCIIYGTTYPKITGKQTP